MRNVFVLGSINMDYSIHCNRLPKKGETLLGSNFSSSQGGKGANQAIASKKLGCDNVYMIASIGNDTIGSELKAELIEAGIDINGLQVKNNSSGSCIIIFNDQEKDNYIILNEGANKDLDIEEAKKFLLNNVNPGDIFVTQLENDLDTIYEGLKFSKELGMVTIFNPAPFKKLDNKYLKYVDIIILNEIECLQMTGLDILDNNNYDSIIEFFNNTGIKNVIVTLGDKGSIYFSNEGVKTFGVTKVDVVDTTSAGDTFIGSIVSMLANGKSIIEGIEFGKVASAITVSRAGSGNSIPTKQEVTNFIKKIV